MTQPNLGRAYDKLVGYQQKTARFSGISALLGWDQQVMMPPGAAEERALQMAALSSLHHERNTSLELVKLVDQSLNESQKGWLSEDEVFNVQEIKNDLENEQKTPARWVEEFSQVTGQAFSQWIEAKKNNNFKSFAPVLKRIITLCQERADFLKTDQKNRYDVLIQEYDPGSSCDQIDPVFSDLQKNLYPKFGHYADAFAKISDPFSNQRLSVPMADQFEFCKKVAQDLHFSFDYGRLDPAPHPFMTTLSATEFRITMRGSAEDFREMLYAVIHETGHALYEMGLERRYYGLPMGQVKSLSLHESQSRFWENNIGRSLEFMSGLIERLKIYAPQVAERLSASSLFQAVNRVERSLIRVEADELTYHAHVNLRYDLEKALIHGDLSVQDLPGAWREKMKQFVGIVPTTDAEGCLQDVHWSGGAFGYFPTYSLGSMMAAQWWEKIQMEVPNVREDVLGWNWDSILGFLRGHIHSQGRRYSSQELCKKLTGRPVDPAGFIKMTCQKLDQSLTV